MRKAKIFVDGVEAGILEERKNKKYVFTYLSGYNGSPVSWEMPTKKRVYQYDTFPPFFDGLLPEGFQLHALLKIKKIDADDYLLQLIIVGQDLVGNVTVEAME